MSQKISLKEVERRVFKSAFQHGLWDIFIGCIILQFAIAPFLSRSLGDFWSSAVFLPFWALVYLVIWLVRKYVVTPRVGVVRFGSWRKTRLARFNVVMLIINVVALIIGFVAAMSVGIVSGQVITIIFALILLIVSSIAAYFLNFTRLYIYGILLALSPAVGEWLYVHLKAPHHGFPITFGITAGSAILVGLVKFIQLLRDYPLPVEGRPSEGAYVD